MIDHFNLRALDLNLLLAFDALIEECSVTHAASRLFVQQPAMSHSLSLLRLAFKDELLVRAGSKMEPTPRALALAGPIRKVLELAQQVLLSRDHFDPAIEARMFRIGLSGQNEAVLMPRLIARLRRKAPNIRLQVRSVTRQNIVELMAAGDVDMAIGYFGEGPAWQRQFTLFAETHVCCFNAALVQQPTPISLASYLETPQVLVSSKSSLIGYMEDALARVEIFPNVVASATHFLALLAIVAEAPVIATLPARVGTTYAGMFNLSVSELPFNLESFPITLNWHARTDDDSASEWLRNVIIDIARELTPS